MRIYEHSTDEEHDVIMSGKLIELGPEYKVSREYLKLLVGPFLLPFCSLSAPFLLPFCPFLLPFCRSISMFTPTFTVYEGGVVTGRFIPYKCCKLLEMWLDLYGAPGP